MGYEILTQSRNFRGLNPRKFRNPFNSVASHILLIQYRMLPDIRGFFFFSFLAKYLAVLSHVRPSSTVKYSDSA